jgi:hypothetical protein
MKALVLKKAVSPKRLCAKGEGKLVKSFEDSKLKFK